MPLPARPFEDAWTLADTEARLQEPPFPSQGTPQEQHAWGRDVARPSRDRLADAAGEHLAWLLQQGRSPLPPHLDEAGFCFLDAMRALIAAPNDPVARRKAGEPFAFLLERIGTFSVRASQPLDAKAIHAQALERMAAGNFDSVLGSFQTCRHSGLSLQIRFRDWAGEAGTVSFPSKTDLDFPRMVFHPLVAGQLSAPVAETLALPVPSGQLWIADWFRLPALQTLSQSLDKTEGCDSMGSAEGRANITRRYAERLGIAHIFCASPDLIQVHGALVAGRLDAEAPEPPGHVGRIYADLRWTSIVDPAHLRHLLADTVGAEEADRQMADYERETDDLIRVEVEPGIHHLYFAGDDATFARTVGERFESEGLFLDETFQWPGFALTAAPLTPILAPSPKRKSPRP